MTEICRDCGYRERCEEVGYELDCQDYECSIYDEFLEEENEE